MIDRVLKAIDYIEAHLHDDLQSAKTSEAACYSHYHFLRTFHTLTGMTVAAYIRRRRLTKAAEALLCGTNRIVEVAQDAGFESQASFSRVFKEIFGDTPARFRRERMKSLHRGQPALTEAYLKHLHTGGVTMIPRFERKETFIVVGLGKDFIFSEPNVIPVLWNDFLRQKHQIEQQLDKAFYGVCYGPKDKETFAEKFHYTAAVRVSDDTPVPGGMERISIEAQEYAVFTHKGRLTGLQNTCNFIWKTWLPKSGFEPADAPDFELYRANEAQCPMDTDEGETEIYVPILREMASSSVLG